MTPMKQAMQPLIGMARLARGRVDGLALFGDTPGSVLASLAPLMAFPLVGAVLMVGPQGWVPAATTLLFTLVAQLAPLVLSHALAQSWGREAHWFRYATALNWCQWALPLAAMALLIALQFGLRAGMTEETAELVLIGGLGTYAIWLNWLLARHGLALSRGRAMGLVLLTSIGTLVLAIGPGLVKRWVG